MTSSVVMTNTGSFMQPKCRTQSSRLLSSLIYYLAAMMSSQEGEMTSYTSNQPSCERHVVPFDLRAYPSITVMDNNHIDLVGGGVQERKGTKIAKTKKKPMKVVYISNPMKFKISASGFRALVQELTGQDSELPDPTKIVDDDDHGVGGNYLAVSSASKTVVDDEYCALEVPTKDPSQEQPARQDAPFGSFDDVFMPQMLENVAGIMPSNSWYEAYSYGYGEKPCNIV
ncbi:hypothetical protein POTOM_051335 [Populus tomentosa]|uniref:VQ domain-containing protein n=2 Tax=Populus TaxID=3689 RepID=A0A8X8C899_POPTO|nr:hypothetical protein POTOM_051335 [Populus tomentosa]